MLGFKGLVVVVSHVGQLLSVSVHLVLELLSVPGILSFHLLKLLLPLFMVLVFHLLLLLLALLTLFDQVFS